MYYYYIRKNKLIINIKRGILKVFWDDVCLNKRICGLDFIVLI